MADALADPKLFIALRGSSLNVYYRGMSLFLVSLVREGEGSSRLTVTTHEKYLVDPARASQVPLNDGAFDVASLENGLIRRYEGPATLVKMKSAAALFSGLEKTGCHEIAVRNPPVVDCEIAFPGSMSPGDGGDKNGAPRVDLASFEPDGDDARLVFWEAKHYRNGELRALEKEDVPVCHQIEVYQKYLSEPRNRTAIEKEYTFVVENLVQVKKEMGWARPLSQMITDIDEDGIVALSPRIRVLIEDLRAEWRALDERIAVFDKEFVQMARNEEPVRRLVTIPGIGTINATALVAAVGNARAFRRGRDMAAWLGLTPRQMTTGGKPRLLGISKRGNRYLRKNLIHGARAVLPYLVAQKTPLGRWACGLLARAHKNVVVVALANKLARIAWVVLARGGVYNAGYETVAA